MQRWATDLTVIISWLYKWYLFSFKTKTKNICKCTKFGISFCFFWWKNSSSEFYSSIENETREFINQRIDNIFLLFLSIFPFSTINGIALLCGLPYWIIIIVSFFVETHLFGVRLLVLIGFGVWVGNSPYTMQLLCWYFTSYTIYIRSNLFVKWNTLSTNVTLTTRLLSTRNLLIKCIKFLVRSEKF